VGGEGVFYWRERKKRHSQRCMKKRTCTAAQRVIKCICMCVITGLLCTVLFSFILFVCVGVLLCCAFLWPKK
jgi:nicotinamide riboside transporter PnuC